jgi:hypothetical protein
VGWTPGWTLGLGLGFGLGLSRLVWKPRKNRNRIEPEGIVEESPEQTTLHQVLGTGKSKKYSDQQEVRLGLLFLSGIWMFSAG